MINDTLKNVQRWFQFVYYARQIPKSNTSVAQVVYLDRNHNGTNEALNKGNGTSPTVGKVLAHTYGFLT